MLHAQSIVFALMYALRWTMRHFTGFGLFSVNPVVYKIENENDLQHILYGSNKVSEQELQIFNCFT